MNNPGSFPGAIFILVRKINSIEDEERLPKRGLIFGIVVMDD